MNDQQTGWEVVVTYFRLRPKEENQDHLAEINALKQGYFSIAAFIIFRKYNSE
jgi:hypothetical protein